MSDSGFGSLTCNLGGAEKDFSEEKNLKFLTNTHHLNHLIESKFQKSNIL